MVNLATDIGGTHGRVAVYENFGENSLEPLLAGQFDVTQKYRGDLRLWSELATDLLSRVGKPLDNVGFSVAGQFSGEPVYQRERLVFSGNLGDWVGKPLLRDVKTLLNCNEVVLGNDAEAAALADAVYGVSAQHAEYHFKDFLGIIWGTGVGGACVRFDGESRGEKLYDTTPGEPGHMVIDPRSDKTCQCGQAGDVEAICGGGNFVRNYGRAWQDLTDHDWEKIKNGMLVGLQNYLRVQPVGLIVFSGAVACNNQPILSWLQAELDHARYGHPKLIVSAFGEDAGTLGALSLLSL